MTSLKSDINDLDIKRKTVPIGLYKLSNIVEKEVVKKDMIDEISFKRVNAIQTIDTCDLVKTAGDNTKIDDIE